MSASAARAAVNGIQRASIRSAPGPGGPPGRFHLPCRKLVFQYNDTWPSSRGARDYVLQGRLASVALQCPSVEVVLQEVPSRHPLVRGFYGAWDGGGAGVTLAIQK